MFSLCLRYDLVPCDYFYGQWLMYRYTNPQVPLVEQQSVFIEKQLPSLRVRKVHGGDALAGDMLNRAEWKKFFDSADIVVMTGDRLFAL